MSEKNEANAVPNNAHTASVLYCIEFRERNVITKRNTI